MRYLLHLVSDVTRKIFICRVEDPLRPSSSPGVLKVWFYLLGPPCSVNPCVFH